MGSSSYTAWRISFQSSEQAAQSAYADAVKFVQQRDNLLGAANEVLKFRVGDLPTLWYIRDSDRSRAAIGRLAATISEIEAEKACADTTAEEK